jgi:flagellar biosynthetic protein FliR
MDEQKLLQLPLYLAYHLDAGWTFLLIFTRFAGLFLFFPGLSNGMQGMEIRIPGLMMISLAVVSVTPAVPVPDNVLLLFGNIASELLLGSILGLLPTMIVSGAQAGGQLASTTMGLGAGQLLDPTTQSHTTQISRIMGDLVVLCFLFINGHHVLIYAASGLCGQIVPGSFVLSDNTIDVIVRQSGEIFSFATIVSSPVIVALLLTQLVLGIVTKFVQQVNVFIVSYPLTIAIGMFLLIIMMPSFVRQSNRYLLGVESTVVTILEDTRRVESVGGDP